MNFKATDKFAKDFKKLAKKYHSLDDDLAVFKKNLAFVDIAGNRKFVILKQNEDLVIIKARFFCKHLKGSTLRIVFSLNGDKNVDLIELFFKGDKEREDEERIKTYLKDS
jgi:hypothetical protein